MDLQIILIILLAIAIIVEIFRTNAMINETNALKQQNKMLWELLREVNVINKELIKENLKKNGEKIDE